MINEILSVFDEALSTKCWMGKYGRLAITGKQSVNGSFKKFPVSCAIADDCENLTEYLTDLLPDDSKSGTAFWKTVTQTSYIPAPGISYNRNMKLATTTLEFLVWVNIRKVTGENTSASWCTDQGSIVRDALKTLDCKRGLIVSGIDYIKNLRIEVIRIGNVESYRQAMSEYSIENIEAITVWPYAAFTLTVKVSFLIAAACIPAYECSTEIDCSEVFYVIDEANNPLADATNVINQ